MTDIYTRAWITEHAQDILAEYSGGITIRQLHYRLVAIGMTNDMNHYKRVVTAMTEARWDDTVDMDAFIDRERSMFGETEAGEKDLEDEITHGKEQIKAWMEAYHLNRWSNQDNYVEVWIEKKALQGVFEPPCEDIFLFQPTRIYRGLPKGLRDAGLLLTSAQGTVFWSMNWRNGTGIRRS